MKKRLRIITTLALACVCFTLSGCGKKVKQQQIETETQTVKEPDTKKQTETQKATQPPTEKQTETKKTTEAPTEKQTEVQPLTDENGETEPTSWDISGTINEISENKLTIETSLGNTYTFPISSATSIADGAELKAGDSITLHYDGNIDDRLSIQTGTVTTISRSAE